MDTLREILNLQAHTKNIKDKDLYDAVLKQERAKVVIKLLRLNGWTMNALAKQLKRSAVTMHRVVYGKTRSQYVESAISYVTGKSPKELWGYEDDKIAPCPKIQPWDPKNPVKSNSN